MTTDDLTALAIAVAVGLAAFLAGWRAADLAEKWLQRRDEARGRRGSE